MKKLSALIFLSSLTAFAATDPSLTCSVMYEKAGGFTPGPTGKLESYELILRDDNYKYRAMLPAKKNGLYMSVDKVSDNKPIGSFSGAVELGIEQHLELPGIRFICTRD